MTEGVSYPVSGVIIATLMTFLIGMSPNPEKAGALYGTSQGLTMALGGFSNTACALVGAALFLAAAMTKTGLDRRIALKVLSLIGTSTNRIIIGVIVVGFCFELFRPFHHGPRGVPGTYSDGYYCGIRGGQIFPFCCSAYDRNRPGR